MKIILCLLLLFSLFSVQNIYGQGCSDAGFCTMGALKPDQHLKKANNLRLRSIEISQYVGCTKFDDYICATTIEGNVGIGKRNTVQVKIPYMYIYSYLQNVHGLGDISLGFTRQLFQKDNWQLSGTLGAKIATNNSNKVTREGLPLPMYQQTSLGTHDIVLGFSLLSKGWLIATGFQQPLINQNKNVQ